MTEPEEAADEPRLPRENVKEMIATYSAIIDENKAQLAAATKHAVEGHAEFTKTIVTLSSGALVLSISVAQLMATRLSHPSGGWLLPTAWVLFTLDVVLSAFRVMWLQDAQSVNMIIERARSELSTTIMRQPTDRELREVVDQTVAPAYDAASTVGVRYHKLLHASRFACAWAFAFGMTALVVFAIANLPY